MIPDRPSLRKKILFPLLSVLVATLSVVAVENVLNYRTILTKRLERRADRIADLIRFIAGSAQKPAELQHIVSVLGGEDGIKLIAVVAGDPAKVVASTRMAMLGRTPGEVDDPEVKEELIETYSRPPGDFRFDQDGESFDYFHPLSVAVQGADGMQLQRGAVLVTLDTRPLRREVFGVILRAIVGYFAAVLVLAVFCWVLLERHVLRPVKQIGDAVSHFQLGTTTRISEGTVRTEEFCGLIGTWNALIDRLDREEVQRTETKAVLQRQQAEMQALFDLVPALIWFKDTENNFLRANQRVVESTGKPIGEIEGKSASEIYPQQAAAYFADDLEVIRSGVPKLGIVEKLPGPDDREIWIQTDKVPYRDQDGKIVGIVVMAQDVTLRQQAEEELRWKTAFLEAKVSSSPDGILVVDQQGRKILRNERVSELFKIPKHIADDKDDEQQVRWVSAATKDPERFFARVAELYAHPLEVGRDEIELKDGTVLDRYSSPVLGKDGEYYGRTWAFRDITAEKLAATALFESRRFLQSTLDALSSHIAILDEHGTIVEVNAAWNRFGSENEIRSTLRGVGENYLLLCDAASGRFAEEAPLVAAGIRAVIAGEREEFHVEYPCHSPIEKRWFTVRVTRFSGDGPVRVVVAHENISERKRAEDLVHQSEERYRSLIDNARDAIFTIAKDGTFTSLNPAAETIAGISRADWIGRPFVPMVHPDDAPLATEMFRRILKGEQTPAHELRGHPSLKRPALMEMTLTAQKDESGKIIGLLGIGRDVTERKRTAVALQNSELRYRSLFENMVEGYARCRLVLEPDQPPDIIYLEVNAAFETLTGLKDVVGKKVIEVIPGYRESNPEVFETYRRVVMTGRPERFEAHLEALGIWLSVTVYCHEKDQFVAVFDNITDRKQKDEELKESEDRFRGTFEQAAVGIAHVSTEGRFLRVNEKLCGILGYSRHELVGMAFADLTLPEDLPASLEALRAMVAGEMISYTSEKRYVRRNGEEIWINLVTTLEHTETEEPKYFIAVIEDITARKRTEDALRESQHFAESIAENSTSIIYLYELGTGRTIYANRNATALLGYSNAELVGLGENILPAIMHPADLPRVAQQHADYATMSDNEVIDLEFRLKNVTGEWRWIWARETIFKRRPDGTPWQILGTAHDVTGRKEAEAALGKAHRELMDASRQAGMAEVASGVLHNVGNVLNSVNTSISVATDKVRSLKLATLKRLAEMLRAQQDLPAFFANDPRGAELPAFLTTVTGLLESDRAVALGELDALHLHIEHINEIVAMQLSYASGCGVIEVLPLTDVIEDALRINACSFEQHGLQVVRDFAEVPPVPVDRHKVLQILVNLIRNAQNALADSPSADRRLTVRLALVSGGQAEIAISDNGVGIPAENLTRIFEHGFTTRKNGHGFGLHSSANTAHEMGGSLTVQSDGPGLGATFTFSMPVEFPCTIANNANGHSSPTCRTMSSAKHGIETSRA